MSIVIKVNPFKASDIKRGIEELKRFKAKIIASQQEYITVIATRFNEILNEEAPEHAKGLWGFKTEVTDEGAVAIFEFAGEVEFIEFGTGIVGKENHEGVNEEWFDVLPPPYTGYESGPKINKVTHEWRYWDGHQYVVTKGDEADPFMYRSLNRLLDEVQEITKKFLMEIKTW